MCDECIESDKKIERYKALRYRVTDKIALDGIGALIDELLAKKAQLHPESKK
jgi:hypothetical protein